MDRASKPRVAVTGAGGLVGSHLVEYLARGGFEVAAIVRSRANAQALIDFVNANKDTVDVTVIEADVTDPAAMRNALRLCDVVVHAAGVVNPYGDRAEIFGINVGGTKNALAAARINDVKHFIFISSLSVITGQGDMKNVDESAPYRPCGEAYADSKIEAEKVVMTEKNVLSVTSLRPGFIYGPRERAWMPRLIKNIKNGKAMLIDGGKRETNTIYIGNLCGAIEKTMLNSIAYGQCYNLTDGGGISKKMLFDAIAEGLDLPRVTKNVPRPLAALACNLVWSFAKNMPPEKQQELSRFSKAAFRLAAINQGFNIKKAERDLGYVNRIPFQEGMSRTLEAFREEAAAGNQSGLPSASPR